MNEGYSLILNANSLHIPLASESVDMCVTSPPYYGLRDYGNPSQLGLEKTPEWYIENMVAVFREVRRVMKPHGTLWLNIGDSYWANRSGNGVSYDDNEVQRKRAGGQRRDDLKPKDLIGIPWMLAFALRQDGWYLRADIIWNKPNIMPESVKDRPTKAHEYIFLLSKRRNYYYDAYAIREPLAHSSVQRVKYGFKSSHPSAGAKRLPIASMSIPAAPAEGRNKRSVWTVNTQSYRGAHFATFPPALIEPCIRAGSSEKGVCPECGAPWERIVESERKARNELPEDDPRYRPNAYEGAYGEINGKADAGYTEVKSIGWKPTCKCDTPPCPAIVLDPFVGTGTSALVARSLGRMAIGLDVHYDYINNDVRSRLSGEGTIKML